MCTLFQVGFHIRCKVGGGWLVALEQLPRSRRPLPCCSGGAWWWQLSHKNRVQAPPAEP